MEQFHFIQFELKRAQIGVRISITERAKIDEFCLKKGVILSDLVRSAIHKVLIEE